MKRDNLELYIRRKSGLDGKGRRWKPSLLLVLSAFILVFSLTFIMSMSDGIKDLIRYMGSGDIRVSGVYEGEDDWQTDVTRSAEALAFSEEKSSGIFLKAVDMQSYFIPERQKVMNLDVDDSIKASAPVIMSESLIDKLELSIGDRLTITYLEEEKGRAVPILATVIGTFSSGYDEFDRMMCYIDISKVRGDVYTEVILPDPSMVRDALFSIRHQGFDAYPWDALYRGLCDNVNLSVNLLYGVFFILAFLTAFFSSSISYDFLERDKKDAASLILLGLPRKRLRSLYVSISFRVVLSSLLLGIVMAIPVTMMTPMLMTKIASMHFDALGNYLLCFDIDFPWLHILVLFSFIVLCSYLSLRLTLRHWAGESIDELVRAE